MAIQDGVDVGLLGLLRGPLHARHNGLARVLLGASLGSLSIDAELADDAILVICQSALSEHSGHVIDARSDETRHRDLAIKMLHMALKELHDLGAMDMCRALLTQLREFAREQTTIQFLAGGTCVASATIGVDQ